MSMMTFFCCLRHNGVRNLIAGIGGCHPRALRDGMQRSPKDVSTPTNDAVYGYQQLSTVRHGHQQTLSVNPSKISAATGIGYLQHAVGVVAEQTLVSRLAAVWKMPTECLLAQVQAVSSLLRPSGLGTTAHALWVLVRSPELRNTTEHQLRSSFRQLQQLVSHLDPDRSALLTAVYKRPWMLAAMIAPAQTSSAAASPTAVPGPVTWKQEAAAILLEVQQQNGSRTRNDDSSSTGQPAAAASTGGSSNMHAPDDSPMLPLAAVRAYLAIKEPVQAIQSVLKRLPWLPPAMSSSSSTLAAHTCQEQDQLEGDQAANSTSTPSSYIDAGTVCSSGHSSCSVKHDQLLQQVLAASPQLILLPPDLLLSRWQLLTSGLLGAAASAQCSAAQLLTTCPYLLLDYADYAACGHHHRTINAYDPNLGGSDYEAAAAC